MGVKQVMAIDVVAVSTDYVSIGLEVEWSHMKHELIA